MKEVTGDKGPVTSEPKPMIVGFWRNEEERKDHNECCRSHLQDAIRSLQKAQKLWTVFPETQPFIDSLRELKTAVKSELNSQLKAK